MRNIRPKTGEENRWSLLSESRYHKPYSHYDRRHDQAHKRGRVTCESNNSYEQLSVEEFCLAKKTFRLIIFGQEDIGVEE